MKLVELVDFVVGVDTHKSTHTAAVVAAGTGAALESATVPAVIDGYDELVELADGYCDASARVWAIEGTGSYGAGLAAFLAGRGEWVIEIDRPSRPARRDGAKDDGLDAVRAAREALSRDKWATPRGRGEREAMRITTATREAAVRDRTRAINQLKAAVVTAPDVVRDQLRHCNSTELVTRCARLRVRPDHSEERRATVACLQRLARRVQHLNDEVRLHDHDLDTLTETHCPELLEEIGVGPIVAAHLYVAWSHPGRCRNEAAFANLGAAAPIPASSGDTIRYRLNRGGDRKLNRALHTVVLTRARCDDETKAYIKRRLAEGKTKREARRCLKRYLARHFYRVLEQTATTT